MNKNRWHFIDLGGVSENKKGVLRHELQVKIGWKQSKMFSQNKKRIKI